MILLISTCKEKMHELEFVRPIEKVLKKRRMKFFVRSYLEDFEKDLDKVDKIIICGTSLKDFDYVNYFEKFSWLKDFKKSVLGICAGVQIIGFVFGAKTKNKKEIGLKKINLRKSFLGIEDNFEGYLLHNLSLKKCESFEILADSGADISAIKIKDKEIYGVMFHPEVRNEKVIEEFLKIK